MTECSARRLLFDSTLTGICCQKTLDMLVRENLLSAEGHAATLNTTSGCLSAIARVVGHRDCVLQARIRNYRCFQSTWCYVVTNVYVCTAEGQIVTALPTNYETRLILTSNSSGGGNHTAVVTQEAAAPLRKGISEESLVDAVGYVLNLELQRMVSNDVATEAVRMFLAMHESCRTASTQKFQVPAARLWQDAVPQTAPRPDSRPYEDVTTSSSEEEILSSGEDDEDVTAAVSNSVTWRWLVGTFDAPPRKVSSRINDKRTCTVVSAVLFDGEREIMLQNLKLELHVA